MQEQRYDVIANIDNMLLGRISSDQKKTALLEVQSMKKDEYTKFKKLAFNKLGGYTKAVMTILTKVYGLRLESKQKAQFIINGSYVRLAKKDVRTFISHVQAAQSRLSGYIRTSRKIRRGKVDDAEFKNYQALAVLNGVGREFVNQAVTRIGDYPTNQDGTVYQVLMSDGSYAREGVTLKGVIYSLVYILRHLTAESLSAQFLSQYAENLGLGNVSVETLSSDKNAYMQALLSVRSYFKDMTLEEATQWLSRIEQVYTPSQIPPSQEFSQSFGAVASDISADVMPDGSIKTRYAGGNTGETVFEILQRITPEAARIKNTEINIENRRREEEFRNEMAAYQANPALPEPKKPREKKLREAFNPDRIDSSDIFHLVGMSFYNTTALQKMDLDTRNAQAANYMPLDVYRSRYVSYALDEIYKPDLETRRTNLDQLLREYYAVRYVHKAYVVDPRDAFEKEFKFKPNIYSLIKKRIEKLENAQKRRVKREDVLSARYQTAISPSSRRRSASRSMSQ